MLDANKVKLGIAPIAWTNDDMPELGAGNTFEQCVSEMALAGFTGCEVGCKFPACTAALKKTLDLRGIRICNRWFSSFLISRPYEETENEFIKALAFLKEMGAGVIGLSEQSYSIQGQNVPIFRNRHVMNDREWDTLCAGLNKLGQIAKDTGMKLCFHHHMGTVVQTAAEIDRMMDNTDSGLLFLLFDSGHLAYCGEDYLNALKKHAERTAHVHLKDIRVDIVKKAREEGMSFLSGVRTGTFTVPGDGIIDFVPIFNTLNECGYEGWMVVEAEQDPAKANPLEYAIKARKYIQSHAGI